MAEGDYEYEKMRCELLGLPAPEKVPDNPRDEDEEEENGDVHDDAPAEGEERLERDQDLEIDNEHIRNVSGGLDELNSILSVTQKKLNKFKIVCGSLTNLLKIKVGTSKADEATTSNNDSQVATDAKEEAGNQVSGEGVKVKKNRRPRQTQHQKDMTQTINSQNDHLDALIEKSENALMNMESQRKQMKMYLAK